MRIISFCLAMMMMACGDTHPQNLTENYLMPKALKDCQVFLIGGDWRQQELYIVRCPDSLTSTTWTKTETCGENCTETKTFGATIK